VRAARRAVGVLVASTPPSSFVVDIDPDADRMITHALISGRPDMTKVVAR